MKGFLSVLFSAVLVISLLAGCGGGGGGGGSTAGGTSTIVSGYAVKGPISGGVVTLYAINSNGLKGNALGSGRTASDGYYAINIGAYTGNIIVEVVGGSYIDEATSASVNNSTLRAAVASVNGSTTVSVTPLTEIAVINAGNTLTQSSISTANSLVSNMIGGINIISTTPVDATNISSQGATQVKKDYGLALAAVSQMIADGTYSNVSTAVSGIANDLSDNKLVLLRHIA